MLPESTRFWCCDNKNCMPIGTNQNTKTDERNKKKHMKISCKERTKTAVDV